MTASYTVHRLNLQYAPTAVRQPETFLIRLLQILAVCSINVDEGEDPETSVSEWADVADLMIIWLSRSDIYPLAWQAVGWFVAENQSL